jgi:hypothetical protein
MEPSGATVNSLTNVSAVPEALDVTITVVLVVGAGVVTEATGETCLVPFPSAHAETTRDTRAPIVAPARTR